MIDEIGLRKDMDRAAKAKALLDNDLLNESFATLRADYLKMWENSKSMQTAEREKLWLATTVLSNVETHLRSLVTNGEIARRELADSGLI